MLKVNSNFFTAIGLSVAIIGFSACNNSGENKAEAPKDSVAAAPKADTVNATKKKAIEYKFATVEANFPSPFEIVNDLYNYQAPFRKDLLNPASNADKYISSFKKEIGFGVYGIDMAYINFYGQNQEMLSYYNVIQKLSRDLNMDKVFDMYIDRFKSNANNKDSVITIIDNVFNETDKYLRKNDRIVAASHLLAGALIELNYLSLNLLKDLKKTPENAPFFEKVYNENLYIYHLIKLYEEYNDKDSKELLASLKDYRKSYDEIIKTSADLTPEKLAQATTLLNKVRTSMIK